MALGFAAAPAALSLASCSHGGYDGSFDSSGLEILAAQGDGATGPPVTKSVSASAAVDTVVTTPDGVFEVDVPAHAFPSDVTITVTPLADRTIENGYVVPTYEVAVTPAALPTLPIQIQFRGNSGGNGGGSSLLAPVALGGGGGGGEAGTTPLVVGGNANTGGPSVQLWAVVSALGGSYSLGYVANVSSQAFLEPATASCLATCCSANHAGGGAGANGQLYGTDVGCACESVSPNLDCFVKNCPDLALLANECVGLRASPSGDLGCPTGNLTCLAPGSVCCFQSAGPTPTTSCGGTGAGCTYAAHCTADSQCGGGSVCCAFDGESLCAASCPPARRVCSAGGADAGACDSGAQCAKAGKCPFSVCGAAPPACR
jgi:hypothetical protein